MNVTILTLLLCLFGNDFTAKILNVKCNKCVGGKQIALMQIKMIIALE